MLQHSGVPSPVEDREDTTWEQEGIRVSDQIPLERRGNFPQNYVESNHRREWFQEKFGSETERCDEETPVEAIQPTEASTATSTPVERIEEEVLTVVVDDSDQASGEDGDQNGQSETEEIVVSNETSEVTPTEEMVGDVDGAVGGVPQAQAAPGQNSGLLKQNHGHLSDNVG